MKRKLAMAALYSLFGAITYLLFLFLTFPSDAARDRMVYEANKAGIRMQLQGFRPALPTGITLTGVDIYGPTADQSNPASRRARARMPRPADPEAGPGTEAGAELDAEPPAPDAAAAPADPSKPESPLLTLDRVTLTSL